MVNKILLIVIFLLSSIVVASDWPKWRGPNQDGTWNETGVIDHFQAEQLQPVWQAPINSGYTGPTVAEGHVYVMDRLTKPRQVERILCFDAQTGQQVWIHSYDCEYRDVGYTAGPRASVVVVGGLAYALGTMGHLHCLDARTGQIQWHKDLKQIYQIQMPTWGIAASPLIEDHRLILQVGGRTACLVALHRQTGEELWTARSDPASYATPILIDQAGQRVLVCYTGDHVVGLSPQTGETYWEVPFPPSQMVIGIATPVYHQGYLLISNFFDGSMLIRLHPSELSAEKVWHRRGKDEHQTDSLHSLISTPLLIDDHAYGIDSYGHFRCLELATGDRVFEDTSIAPIERWSTAHFVKNGDQVWIFNEKGELMLAKFSPQGVDLISRAQIIQPTRDQLNQRGGVCWSHPAFANKHIFVRNDEELVCINLGQ